jgi:hypothetical protein
MKMEAIFLSKHPLILMGPHSGTSQKIELFKKKKKMESQEE